jgi:hypothetical protein
MNLEMVFNIPMRDHVKRTLHLPIFAAAEKEAVRPVL